MAIQSDKPVKPLAEIILPYSFIPPVPIELCVNGDQIALHPGVLAHITVGQFEALLSSDYGKYLN